MSLRPLGKIAATVLIAAAAASPSASHGQSSRAEPPCLPFVPPVPIDHRPAAVAPHAAGTTPPLEPGAGYVAPPAATNPPPSPSPSPSVFLPPRELPALPQFSSNRYDAIDARIRDLRSRIRRSDAPAEPTTQAGPPIAASVPRSAPPTPMPPEVPSPDPMATGSTSPAVQPAPSSLPGHSEPAPSSPAVASAPAMSAAESSSVPGSVTPGASVATLPTAEAPTAQQSIPPQTLTPPEHTTPAPALSPAPDHAPRAIPSMTETVPKPSHRTAPHTRSAPEASALAKTEEHTPLIPIEVLRAPVDQLALADNLYAARSYAMALEAYRGVEGSAATTRTKSWSSFQAANCLRQLGQIAEAEKQYRRVAGDSASGEFGELSKWWLSSLEQKRQLQARLEAITQTLARTTEAGRDDAGN